MPCDIFMDSNSNQNTPQLLGNGGRSAGELARLLKNDYYLMVESLEGHDSIRALSPLPGSKAKTQIRCDRLIAARCGCFRKQGTVCLMRNALEEDRQGWEIVRGESEVGKKEGDTK